MARGRTVPWVIAAVLLAVLGALGVRALWRPPTYREVVSFPAPLGREASGDVARSPWRWETQTGETFSSYERFEVLGVADGLPSERITTVFAEGETLSVGTEGGLAIRRGGTWTVLTTADGLGHDHVTALARDPETGDLWIGTLGGLGRLTGGAVRLYTHGNSGLANDVVYDLASEEGLLWAATGQGVCCLDTHTGTWAIYDAENTALAAPGCSSVVLGPQRVWVGVWGGGVAELDRVSGLWKDHRDPDGEAGLELMSDDGVVSDVTTFLAYDDGVLWQASPFGFSRFDGRRWRSYLAADTGLATDDIRHVASRGAVAYLATSHGFGVFRDGIGTVYRRAQEGGTWKVLLIEGVEAERWRLETALPADDVRWVEPAGDEVWLATSRGLVHGLPERRE